MYRLKHADESTQDSCSILLCRIFIYVSLPACVAIVCWYLIDRNVVKLICHHDYNDNGKVICRPTCPPKYFSLPGMTKCEPWLTCQDTESDHLKIGKLIGRGAVKRVYHAHWKGHSIVYNILANSHYKDDFLHGFKMLAAFQGTRYVTQVLGFCEDSYFTEYHRLGSAANISGILQKFEYRALNTVEVRIGLCMDYVEIVNFFHTSPLGTRVMCDSNDLKKTLSQYLLHSDLSLVANDLDALPKTNRSAGLLIKCGHRQIYGEFPAPEQLWPHDDRNFSDPDMPPYDEKSDIWKIPNVCDYFLGNVPGSDAVRFHLFNIHRLCKQREPMLRPTAQEVLDKYIEIKNKMAI